jgi:hypothetical protein
MIGRASERGVNRAGAIFKEIRPQADDGKAVNSYSLTAQGIASVFNRGNIFDF